MAYEDLLQTSSIAEKMSRLRCIYFDVDGVFTDASLWFSSDGSELKRFNVHDGLGCILLKKLGISIVIISSRRSDAVTARFTELGITSVNSGVLDKASFVRNHALENKFEKHSLAFMGDDLPDLMAFSEVGLSIAPASAVDEVKRAAGFVTRRLGGKGAVREVCDLIIGAQENQLISLFKGYLEERRGADANA